MISPGSRVKLAHPWSPEYEVISVGKVVNREYATLRAPGVTDPRAFFMAWTGELIKVDAKVETAS